MGIRTAAHLVDLYCRELGYEHLTLHPVFWSSLVDPPCLQRRPDRPKPPVRALTELVVIRIGVVAIAHIVAHLFEKGVGEVAPSDSVADALEIGLTVQAQAVAN